MATEEQEIYERALSLFSEGWTEAAIEQFAHAVTIKSDFTEALHGLAMAYAEREMFDKAVETARELEAVAPGDLLADTSLSILYRRAGISGLGGKRQARTAKSRSVGPE